MNVNDAGVWAPTPVLLWSNSMSKNATPSDNSDGHDESIDSEPRTDGGVSRRVFLGAAAALSALPAVGGTAAATDGGGDEGGQEDGEEPATLNAGFFADQFDYEASYRLRTYRDDPHAQVGLEIGAEFGGVTLEMTSVRAEQLANELLEAAQAGDA